MGFFERERGVACVEASEERTDQEESLGRLRKRKQKQRKSTRKTDHRFRLSWGMANLHKKRRKDFLLLSRLTVQWQVSGTPEERKGEWGFSVLHFGYMYRRPGFALHA